VDVLSADHAAADAGGVGAGRWEAAGALPRGAMTGPALDAA